jgi:hypothetical protein
VLVQAKPLRCTPVVCDAMNLLTPTIAWLPLSMRACWRAAHSSILRLGSPVTGSPANIGVQTVRNRLIQPYDAVGGTDSSALQLHWSLASMLLPR